MKLLQVILLAAFSACACSNPTGPDVLHIANVTTTKTSQCGFQSCVATIRFRLLNQRSLGRSGRVIASSYGGIIGQTVTTGSDGRGAVDWGFDLLDPATVIICPAEVSDAARCATAGIR